jgi:hypothetical protein
MIKRVKINLVLERSTVIKTTQCSFEVFLKSPVGNMNGGKTIGTISMFDR